MKERFETFTVLIAKINRSIRRIKNREMAEYGLRSAHVSCLYYLYSEKGLTATELCDRCEEDKATISRALDHLEEENFIIRGSKRAKRYNSPLYLTQKGKEVGERIADKIGEIIERVGLKEERRAELYRSLTTISDGLELCASSHKARKIENKV